MPTLEPTDTLQTLLKKWLLYCTDHQPPSIAMQGEWMICPSCCLKYAMQSAILVLRETSQN